MLSKYQKYIFPVLDVALNGINYFFHIVVAWYLTSGDYGILNSLLSISAVLITIGISIQSLTAKSVTQDNKSMIRYYLGLACKLWLVIFTVSIVVMDTLEVVTRGTSLQLLMLLGMVGINILLSTTRGILQGTQKFLHLNLSFYVEVGVKMVALLILLPKYKNINVIMIALLLGMLFALIHGVIVTCEHLKLVVKTREVVSGVFRTTVIVFLSNFFIYLLQNMDMIIVNYRLPLESGEFAVVLKYCQIFVAVTFSIITVFFPMIVEASGDRSVLMRHIRNLLYIILGGGMLGVVCYMTFVPYTVEWLFGAEYSSASELLVVGGLAYLMLCCNFAVINVFIAIDKYMYFIPLAIISGVMVLMLVFVVESLLHVFVVEICLYSLLAIILISRLIREVRKNETH